MMHGGQVCSGSSRETGEEGHFCVHTLVGRTGLKLHATNREAVATCMLLSRGRSPQQSCSMWAHANRDRQINRIGTSMRLRCQCDPLRAMLLPLMSNADSAAALTPAAAFTPSF